MFTDVKDIDEKLYIHSFGRIVDAIVKKNGTSDYENLGSTYYEQLLEIKDAILGNPGETLNSIEDGTVEENKLPKTYTECLDAIACAIGGNEWNREEYLWDCLSPLKPDTELLGKTASELVTGIRFTPNKFVKGVVHYVKDYTGFSSNVNEQEGYYFAFGFTADENVTGAKFKVLKDNKDASGLKAVTCDTENIAYLGKTLKDVLKRRIVIAAERADGVEEKVYLNMSDLTVSPIKSTVNKELEDILEKEY